MSGAAAVLGSNGAAGALPGGCAGVELAYDPEKSPSRWKTLAPAYFVSALPWFFGKLEAILIPDATRAAVPAIVIYLMLHVQTKQPLLAAAGVFVILFAIALTLIFFGVVVGGTWLSVYAYPALYITVGVGVDDIFVMTRAWMLCPQEHARDRLAATYRIAGEMMLATTLTSCAAFLSTALLSPMVAMQCLGFITFASLLFDYLLVLTLYAACLVLCHERTRPPSAMQRAGAGSVARPTRALFAQEDVSAAEEVAAEAASASSAAAPPAQPAQPPPPTATECAPPVVTSSTSSTSGSALDNPSPAGAAAAIALEEDGPDDASPRVAAKARAMRRLSSLTLHAPGRFRRPVIGCFVALLLPFVAWQLQRLAIDTLPPSFLRWDHPLQRAYLDNADFATSPLDVFDTVHLFWGLAPGALDLTGVNRLRRKAFQGEPMLDSRFALDAAAQRHLLRACELLRRSELVPSAGNLASADALKKAVHCWPEAFRTFVEGSGHPFPVEDSAEVEELLLDWLGAEAARDEAKGAEFAQDIGFVPDGSGESGESGGGTNRSRSRDGLKSQRQPMALRFVKLRASSTIKAAFPPPYWQLQVQYGNWERLVAQVNALAPPSAAHAVQVLVSLPGASSASDLANKWIQVSMHLAYVTLTGTGLAIGLVVCLPVLLLSTRSWPISAIAAACLVCVILGVVASMLACGWKVGMVEALCLIIVSGLYVDPVLHIASAFSQASPRLRPVARAQLAVERMGPPLLASAVTTLASAVCLSTCQLTLLSKIGLFMIFSTIWSLGTSVTLLPALLATFGPAPCGCSCTCSCSSSPVFLVTMRRHRVRGAVPLEHEDSITCQL